MRSNFFPEDRDIYEIMLKKVAETAWPQAVI
jgi:hypothetical protein